LGGFAWYAGNQNDLLSEHLSEQMGEAEDARQRVN